MDIVKMKWKKNLMIRAWERCWSSLNKKSSSSAAALRKCKSWHGTSTEDVKRRKKRQQVAPEGCFTVYVGPERQRFVVKAEFANHPLFKMLLEDAELEYGFNSDGPILLPCDVDLFYKVLAEMDRGEEISPVWSFTKGYSPLVLLRSPSRRQISSVSNGYGSYKILSPSRLLKLNSL